MVVQVDAVTGRHASRHANRRDYHLGSHLRHDFLAHCHLDAVDLHLCLQDEEDHHPLLVDEGDRCHLGGVDLRQLPQDEGDHYRLDVVDLRQPDAVDHRVVVGRLDVMNCLDLGERSWNEESAGERPH